ncbi:hypothetical protein [Desulfopila inferna]|uniref:hypothetical protein n=1 Tax=Desulfopila inferna TaxID=468528 RepID=UPI0019639D76|nr:hypothetical protein [Desulfopila inferna]MBM9604303.1 hypothetical protein [Desulfopila inferna]
MKLSIEESIPECIGTLQVDEEAGGKRRVSAECLFPPSFIGFAGHFPGNPVLPAIVQLAAVRCIAEQALQQHLVAEKYSRTKFRTMIQPDQKVSFQLIINANEGGYKGKFHLRNAAQESIAEGLFVFNTQE